MHAVRSGNEKAESQFGISLSKSEEERERAEAQFDMRTMKIPFAWSKLNALLNMVWAFHCQYIGSCGFGGERGMRPEQMMKIQYADGVCERRYTASTERLNAERIRLKTRIRRAVKVVPECVFNRRVRPLCIIIRRLECKS